MSSLEKKIIRRVRRVLRKFSKPLKFYFNQLRSLKISSLVTRLKREAVARYDRWKQPRNDSRSVVFVIVSNPAIYDSRVIKQTKSLLAAGYRVILFATKHPEWPNHHLWDGIEIRRFGMLNQKTIRSSKAFDQSLACFGNERTLIGTLYEQVKQRSGEAKSSNKMVSQDSKEALREAQRFLKFLYATISIAELKFDERPVMIHAHDLLPLGGALLWAQRCGSKVIYDAHEIETERVPPMPPERKRFVDSIERQWLQHVDAMIVCCNSAADFYADRFQGPRPVVVMNAPESKPVHKTHVDLRTLSGIPSQVPLVVYTGIVGREGRGLHLALAALQRLPEFHLVVLGPRHPGNDTWLTDIALQLDVYNRLHMLKPVEPHMVTSAIQAADLGIGLIQDVSLSYRYALPNKLFEAAFAGLPMVVSDLPEMAEFVLANKIGVAVDQTDPDAIAAGISEVYHNNMHFRPSPEAINDLKTKYGWPRQAEKLLTIYDKLLGAD